MSRFQLPQSEAADPGSTLGKVVGFGRTVLDFAKEGKETFDAVKEVFDSEDEVRKEELKVRNVAVNTSVPESEFPSPVLDFAKSGSGALILGGLFVLAIAGILSRR